MVERDLRDILRNGESSGVELKRESSGLVRYELELVPGSSLEDLDLRRLSHYFASVRGQEHPERDDRAGWERLLVNTDLLEERRRLQPAMRRMQR